MSRGPGGRAAHKVPLKVVPSGGATGPAGPSVWGGITGTLSTQADLATALAGKASTTHAASHQPGGGDALAVDAAAGVGSLRTLGATATTAAAGNDARFTDARAPTAHAASHATGGSDPLAKVPIAVTFSAADFTPDAGTWTVAAGDVVSFTYLIEDHWMTVVCELQTTTVAGAPSILNVKIPAGKSAARQTTFPHFFSNNGTLGVGLGQVIPSGNQVRCFNAGFATWANSTDNAWVRFTASFEIL